MKAHLASAAGSAKAILEELRFTSLEADQLVDICGFHSDPIIIPSKNPNFTDPRMPHTWGMPHT